MANKEFDFFNTEEKSTEPQISSSKEQSFDFFSTPSSDETWAKPEAPSISEQLKNAPGLVAREGAAFFHSLPSELAESYRFIAGKLQGYGEDLAATEGREITDQERALTDKFVNYVPDLVKNLREKFPKVFPLHEESKKILNPKIEKNLGFKLPEKPRGAVERGAVGVGKATPALVLPGSALTKGLSVATSAATEALDLSEKSKFWSNVSIPAIAEVARAILQKRYIPSGAEAQRLLQAGERLGMTNRELAPILATEGQVGRHGRRAAAVQGTREGFERTGNVLGEIVHDLQGQPGAAVAVGPRAERDLLTSLRQIEQDMTGRTHALSPREQGLVDFIRTTITDIEANGSSPRQLIGTWRSVNRIGAGRTELRRILDPVLEAIESVNPQIARDLVDSNALYSRYSQNLRHISPTQFNHFMDAGELQQVLGSIFTMQPETLGKSLLRFFTLKGFEKISSTILTNPNAQSLVRNFGQAVRDGRGASARALGIQLKEYIKKELPEEYEDVDWKALGIED